MAAWGKGLFKKNISQFCYTNQHIFLRLNNQTQAPVGTSQLSIMGRDSSGPQAVAIETITIDVIAIIDI